MYDAREQLAASPLVAERKAEALAYVRSFYQRSWDWRAQSFHAKWDTYDRNCNGIYDPGKASMKEPWQSTMFVDITSQNVEIVAAQLFKTLASPNPVIRTEAGPDGDELQARLIEDIVQYELSKANFKPNFYDSVFEAAKYGSGFMKLFWEKVVETRQRRVPINEPMGQVVDRASPEALGGQAPMPAPGLQGFEMRPVEVLRKNFLATKYVHIRDIFPEPNTTTWDKVIHRDKITYGEICRHIKTGAFMDVKAEIENMSEGDRFEADLQAIKSDLGYTDMTRQLSKFEKKHTVWELWAPIPRKWIYFDMPEGDEAEELVPAKLMVVSGVALLASEENQQFDGETPILKIDYLRIGQTYGKGICEKIIDDQEEINEITNLGIDNLNLIINKGLAVIETALVNPEQDLVSKPGMIIRLKANIEDVGKAVQPIEFPDLASSYFKHRFDIERGVQEKTGAGRVTLGTSDTVQDTNQTLGGMELLKQSFNDRLAAPGMTIEAGFIMPLASKIYGLIYQNLQPEDLKAILGDKPVVIAEIPGPMGMMPMEVPRYLAFAYPPPELVNSSYRFKPMGIFTLENKIIKAAQFMDWFKLFAPFLNPTEAAWFSSKLLGNDADEMQKIILPAMPMMPGGPMGPGGPVPPPGGPPGAPPQKSTPGMKGGPNGNGPSFLPDRNPVRSQPLA